MPSSWTKALERWVGAQLIDAGTADRIRAWEAERDDRASQHRLAAMAFGFGGLLLTAGVFLFVSAHWDELGPGSRFALVLGVVAAFHLGGALSAIESPPLAMTLHATGTAALGAGIFLCGQIFNMAEHWPGALMLWVLGAAAGLYWLRDWPHVLWVALLAPAWLWGEWSEAVQVTGTWWRSAPPAVGMVLLSFAYLAAAANGTNPLWRRVLARLGAALLIPACIYLGMSDDWFFPSAPHLTEGVLGQEILAWAVAVALPFAVAFALRGNRALLLLVPLIWAVSIARMDWHSDRGELALYGLYALGAAGLVGWAIRERSRLYVNLGVMGFALTLGAFYFSSIFDKLSRALGLIGMGVLFLGGGWLMERMRRGLIARMGSDNT